MRISNVMSCSVVAGALALGLVAPPASAQQAGLVNVSLTNVDVLNDIARDINVNVSQIPVSVQAPIGIAANVCNVAANVLAADVDQDGAADCTAESTSTAFNRIVQRQIASQQ